MIDVLGIPRARLSEDLQLETTCITTGKSILFTQNALI